MERLERYRKYIELKQKEREIKAEIDKIKADVLNELWIEEKNECSIDGAKFSVGKRKRWEYSPVVNQMDNELKAMKKLEEANGSATLLSEGNHVKITLPKVSAPKREKFTPKTGIDVVDNNTGEVIDAADYSSPFAD